MDLLSCLATDALVASGQSFSGDQCIQDDEMPSTVTVKVL